MKRKIGILLVACIVMSCILISCQETHSDEKEANFTLEQQTQDTIDSNEDVGHKESRIEDILSMTYRELRADGKTMTLSHYEGGASPVYEMAECEGVYIVFPAVSDVAQMSETEESINDEFPVKLLVQSAEVEIEPGLKVGMTAGETNTLFINWDDIYMSSENSLYYTSFKNDKNKIIAAWSIPDDMFSEWVTSLNDEDDYYAKFLEFIQPFKSEPVGTIVELTVKKVE